MGKTTDGSETDIRRCEDRWSNDVEFEKHEELQVNEAPMQSYIFQHCPKGRDMGWVNSSICCSLQLIDTLTFSYHSWDDGSNRWRGSDCPDVASEKLPVFLYEERIPPRLDSAFSCQRTSSFLLPSSSWSPLLISVHDPFSRLSKDVLSFRTILARKSIVFSALFPLDCRSSIFFCANGRSFFWWLQEKHGNSYVSRHVFTARYFNLYINRLLFTVWSFYCFFLYL